MDLQTATIEQTCSQIDIAGYLDGELKPQDELLLEKHFAFCKSCLNELNLQKKMLSALDFAFNSKNCQTDIQLPKNFAKVVATTAESKVIGLRLPEERFRAFYLCSGLFLFVLAGLGVSETSKLWSALVGLTDRLFVISGLALNFLYDVAVGVSVIARALSQQFVVSSIFPFLLLICVFTFSFIFLSRFIIRYNRI